MMKKQDTEEEESAWNRCNDDAPGPALLGEQCRYNARGMLK